LIGFLKILLFAVFLLVLAFIGFGIKLLFDKNAKFTGGGCSSCACGEEETEKCETS
jgi:ABC-type antimicrobial peptide transport system permease subunit